MEQQVMVLKPKKHKWQAALSAGLLTLSVGAGAGTADRTGLGLLSTINTQSPPATLSVKSNIEQFETERSSLLAPNKPKREISVDWEENKDVQYAIFRSSGDIYFKGRAGYLTDKTKEEFEDISIEEIINTFDDNGALGIGAGYVLKSGNKIEFDYTITKRAAQIIQIEYLF